MTTLAVSTTATVPWWYVAALAGGFTIFGAVVTLTGLLITSRRKNRLDDSRRFDADVIEGYVTLDRAVHVMHNNLGETKEDNDAWWDTYREVIHLVAKLQLITSPEIAGIAEHMRIMMGSMAPQIGDAHVMPELVESLEELRHTIRAKLRIAKPRKDITEPRGVRGWWYERQYRRMEQKFAEAQRIAPKRAVADKDEIPWPDEPPPEDEPSP